MVIDLDLIFVDGSTPLVLKQRNIPFRIPQGIDVEITFTVRRSNGAVQNLTGWGGFEFTLKGDTDDGIGTEIISRSGAVTNAATGRGHFFITPSDTVTATSPTLLPASGPCVADIIATRPGGFVERLLTTTDVQLGPPVAIPGGTPTVASVAATLIAGAVPARVAALVNVATLSGPQTINGVAVVAGDVVLLTAQSTATTNGPWEVKAGAWTRPGSFPVGTHARQVLVTTGEGTSGADSLWICTTNAPSDVVDTDSLAFAQVSGGSGSGTVSDVSVVTANGLAGTVATSTTTPAITLATTVTGLLKGNGTAISAAIPGTDYQAPGSYITALTGDVTATGPGSAAATIAALAVTDAKVAAANKDGAAGVFSMRTLGTGALQACAGNDGRLTPAFGWSMVKQIENGVQAGSPSSFGSSTGIWFNPTQPISITGVRFWWAGGADTVRASLWGPISHTFSTAPNIAFLDVAVSAAGIYVATFSSPYSVTSGLVANSYSVSALASAVNGLIYGGNSLGDLIPGNAAVAFLANPYMVYGKLYIYSAGDILPTSDVGPGFAIAVEPVFTVS